MQKGLLLRKMPAFNTRELGQTAISALTVGRTSYHTLYIKVEGQGIGANGTAIHAAQVIDQIDLVVDNKSVFTIYPWMQMLFQEHFNRTSDTYPGNYIVIPLIRPGFPNSDWPTGDLESFQVHCKIKKTLPTNTTVGADACSFTAIKGWYEGEELDTPLPLGDVFVQGVYAPATPAAGKNVIENVGLGDIRYLSRLFLAVPPTHPDTQSLKSASINNVSASILGRSLIEETDQLLNQAVMCHNWQYKNANPPGTFRGFFLSFDQRGSFKEMPELIDGNRRLPLKLEYEWDAVANAVTPFVIMYEGIRMGKAAPTVAAS